MKIKNPLKISIITGCIILAAILVLISCARIAESVTDSESEKTETLKAETVTSASSSETTTQTATVSDTTPPVIEGVTDRVVHIGDSIAYKQGVTVTDDIDPSPSLEVNTDNVNMSLTGEYTVIYTARDASGNVSNQTATIKVVEQESITTETANALADEILASIVTDDMSDAQKLEAVWWHIYSLGYVDIDYGEVDEYLDNAYYYLTRMMGNCRCVYASSRLLLERLGYKTIRMQNAEDAAQTHYWNLVSLDDGETWYHFDPTCWGWEEAYIICMVSDNWLNEYSWWHDLETYDWVVEDYPATPAENYADDYFGDRCLYDETGFHEYYYEDMPIGAYQYNGEYDFSPLYEDGDYNSWYDEEYYEDWEEDWESDESEYAEGDTESIESDVTAESLEPAESGDVSEDTDPAQEGEMEDSEEPIGPGDIADTSDADLSDESLAA